MNRLSDNQKRLSYPIVGSFPREFRYYNVIRETKTKYILEGNIHVSKVTGKELTPLSRDGYVVNFGKYFNEDRCTNFDKITEELKDE